MQQSKVKNMRNVKKMLKNQLPKELFKMIMYYTSTYSQSLKKCYAQSLFQGFYKPIKKIVIPQISSTTITRPFERSDRKITVIIFINDIVVHSLTFMILVLLNTKKKKKY